MSRKLTAKGFKLHKPNDTAQLASQANPTRKARRKTRNRWLWFAAVLGLGAVWYFTSAHDTVSEKNAYLAETVRRGNIENAITAVGKINPSRSINVGAQVSGQLQSLKVEIGDSVTEGQLLAEIDPSPSEKRLEMAQAQLDNLKAQLLNKQAQLELKKLNAARQRSLLKTRSVSQSIIDQADAELTMADADVRALSAQIRQQEAQVDSYRVDLGYTKIYSPTAGTVVDQAAKEGETLNAAQSTPTIVTIADLQLMTVEAQVSEADIGSLKIGMPAYFTLLGRPDKHFTGTLRQIKPTPQITNNVVLYDASFDVPNPDGELMIDMSAQVYFVIDQADDVLLVPNSALQDEMKDGKSITTVQLVNKDGSLSRREVEIGVRSRVEAEVKSGLEEGDKVVVTTGANSPNNSESRGRRSGMRMF